MKLLKGLFFVFVQLGKPYSWLSIKVLIQTSAQTLTLPLVLFFTCVFVSACAQVNYLIIADADKTVGSVEIFHPQALTVLSPNAKVSVRGEGYLWVEGPLWVDEGQYLLFSDIPNNVIRRYDPKTGHRIFLKNSGASVDVPRYAGAGSNGLVLNNDGQLVIMQHGNRQVVMMNAELDKPNDVFNVLVDQYQRKKLNSPNDGVFDHQGNLFFTDPPYGLSEGHQQVSELGFNGVYRLSAQGDVVLLDDKVTFPNGIALSPDQKTLYVAVSDRQQPLWYAYDLDSDGNVSNKRVFYRVKHKTEGHKTGLPDGMAVHSSGLIFATGPDGVWLFNPEGELLAKINTGQHTSNCALTTYEEYLFITADDYLMSIPLVR